MHEYMGNFLNFLIERLSPESKLFGTVFVGQMCKELGLEQMAGKNIPGLAGFRVKPVDKTIDRTQLLQSMKQFAENFAGAESLTGIKIMSRSPQSSKFPSIQFTKGGEVYDITLALGSNKGEDFEKTVFNKLDTWINAGGDQEEVINMITALNRVDPTITLDNIAGVRASGGSPRRPTAGQSSGSVIADIVLILDDGTERNISLKDRNGGTFANLGGGRDLIDPKTYAVNKNSSAYNLIIEAGFDLKKIQQGYKAYGTDKQVSFDPVEQVLTPVTPGSMLHSILAHGWGSDYIYLREDPKDPTGWYSLAVTPKTLKATLLKNIVITTLRYPHKGAKQITIMFGNKDFHYELALRNSKGGIIPTEIKIRLV